MGLIVACVRLYMLVLFLRIIFSWLPLDYRRNEFCAFIHKITEPVLAPFRRLLPPMGGIDFSPMLVFVLLEVFLRLLRT